MENVAVTIFDKVPMIFVEVPVTFCFGKLYFSLLNYKLLHFTHFW